VEVYCRFNFETRSYKFLLLHRSVGCLQCKKPAQEKFLVQEDFDKFLDRVPWAWNFPGESLYRSTRSTNKLCHRPYSRLISSVTQAVHNY